MHRAVALGCASKILMQIQRKGAYGCWYLVQSQSNGSVETICRHICLPRRPILSSAYLLGSGEQNQWQQKFITVSTNKSGFLHNKRKICKFNVVYRDVGPTTQTGNEDGSTHPLVLGLHGTPGSDSDLYKIMKPLAENGCRVIIPNFPGFGHTFGETKADDDYFQHTIKERSDFVISFLHALGVKRPFDLVICHSAAGYPVTYLEARLYQFTRSALLICPGVGHVAPVYGTIPIIPIAFLKPFIKLWDNDKWKAIFDWIFVQMVKLIPVTYEKVEYIKNTFKVLTGINYKKMPQRAAAIQKNKLPLTYIYCDGDPIIARKASETYASMFGVTPDSIDRYNKEMQLVQTATLKGDHYIKGVMFTRRTHFPPNHSDLCYIIVQEAMALLQVVTNQPSQTSR